MGATPVSGAAIPRYRPRTPSRWIDFFAQSNVPRYKGCSPAAGKGIVWRRTLIVSSGWPVTTVHTPPNPPDRKYLTGLVLVVFSSDDIFANGKRKWTQLEGTSIGDAKSTFSTKLEMAMSFIIDYCRIFMKITDVLKDFHKMQTKMPRWGDFLLFIKQKTNACFTFSTEKLTIRRQNSKWKVVNEPFKM